MWFVDDDQMLIDMENAFGNGQYRLSGKLAVVVDFGADAKSRMFIQADTTGVKDTTSREARAPDLPVNRGEARAERFKHSLPRAGR